MEQCGAKTYKTELCLILTCLALSGGIAQASSLLQYTMAGSSVNRLDREQALVLSGHMFCYRV